MLCVPACVVASLRWLFPELPRPQHWLFLYLECLTPHNLAWLPLLCEWTLTHSLSQLDLGFRLEALSKYWVGQKLHWSFSIKMLQKNLIKIFWPAQCIFFFHLWISFLYQIASLLIFFVFLAITIDHFIWQTVNISQMNPVCPNKGVSVM